MNKEELKVRYEAILSILVFDWVNKTEWERARIKAKAVRDIFKLHKTKKKKKELT